MNQSVDRRHRRHRILEDFVPLAEHQVGADEHAASFETFGEKGKEYFHLLSALLHVTQVIQGQLVVSCGDLPDPWISNDHKHAIISLRARIAKPWKGRSMLFSDLKLPHSKFSYGL